MGVDEYFKLLLIEIEKNRSLEGYYKFLQDTRSFLFRKTYFCQRLQYILDNIGKKEQMIWDCGCGYGTTALFLAMNGYHVYGTTLEFYFAAIAERKRYWSQFGDTSLFDCRYENLFESAYDRNFDTIILQDTLHHVEPIDKGLVILHKALRANGKLLIVEENGSNIIQNLKLIKQRGFKKTITIYDERLKREILLGNENIRSQHRWQQLLQKKGFAVDGKSVQYIRLLPPFLIGEQTAEALARKEAAIAVRFPWLKKHFFFGTNFKAVKQTV